MPEAVDARLEVQRVMTMIAKTLVDEPAKVRTETVIGTDETTVRLQLAPADLSRLTQNKILQSSLRDLAADISAKHRQPLTLTIVAADVG